MKSRLVGTIIAVAVAVIPWTVIQSISGTPDTFLINSVRCYQDIGENGDMLCVVHYDLDYATLPAEFIDAAFVARFLTSTTEVNSVAPFVYTGTITATSSPPSRGYGEGVLSFYWTAADVADFGLTWEGSGYTVVLQGNPTVFTSTAPQLRYSAIEWRNPNQSAVLLGKDVLVLARALDLDWVSNAVALREVKSNQTVLTDDGVVYFTGAIPNLDLFASEIFSSRVITPPVSELPAFTSTAEGYEGFWDNTDVGAGFTTLASLLNMPVLLVRTILLTLVMIVAAVVATNIAGRTDIGVIAALGLILPIGATIGMAPMALVLSAALLAALVLAFNFVYKPTA